MVVYDFKNKFLTDYGFNDPLLSEEINKTKGEKQMAENKPETVFRAGGVKATVWKNKVKTSQGDKDAFSVSVIKSYKVDDSDEWKETSSYFANDVPKLLLVTQKAYEYIALAKEQS